MMPVPACAQFPCCMSPIPRKTFKNARAERSELWCRSSGSRGQDRAVTAAKSCRRAYEKRKKEAAEIRDAARQNRRVTSRQYHRHHTTCVLRGWFVAIPAGGVENQAAIGVGKNRADTPPNPQDGSGGRDTQSPAARGMGAGVPQINGDAPLLACACPFIVFNAPHVVKTCTNTPSRRPPGYGPPAHSYCRLDCSLAAAYLTAL